MHNQENQASSSKTCRVCLKEKPLSSYYKSQNNKSGYRDICMSCRLQEIKVIEKLCPKCSTTKSGTKFNRSRNGTLSAYCKDCYKEVNKGIREEKRASNVCARCTTSVPGTIYCETCAAKDNGRKKDKYFDNKQKCVAYFAGVCADCGYKTDILDVYEFHHLDPNQKDICIGHIMKCGWPRIESELKKCVMLCANCHKIRHWKMRQRKSMEL